jgi:hypothetical protein
MLGCTDAIPIGVTEPLVYNWVVNPQWKVLAVRVDCINHTQPLPPQIATLEG